jgi:hypothetical protein
MWLAFHMITLCARQCKIYVEVLRQCIVCINDEVSFIYYINTQITSILKRVYDYYISDSKPYKYYLIFNHLLGYLS